jgi:hypothetical protein
MSPRRSAPQLNRGAQGLQGIVIRFFELFPRSEKLSGSFLDQLLQFPDAAVFFHFPPEFDSSRLSAHVGSCSDAGYVFALAVTDFGG